MRDLRCWGIYRELAHSPGRESDDARILRRTGEVLREHGFDVTFQTPEEAAGITEAPPPFAFVMCERKEILGRLLGWESEGTLVVNPVSGILNTYRDLTVARFSHARVPFPRTALVATDSVPETTLGACWVKRADVHCTEPGDVVFAEGIQGIGAALLGLSRRGIARAALQEHVPGDLIKFYGVGEDWFVWFYHRDQKLSRHRFPEAELARVARLGAAALGLEVWGGDAIATPDGRIVLIDLNAWPSFALFREEAAAHIAAHLASRFRAQAESGLQAAAGR
jgi:hypothetical protein